MRTLKDELPSELDMHMLVNNALGCAIYAKVVMDVVREEKKKNLLAGITYNYYYRNKLRTLCDFTFKGKYEG